MMFPMYTPASAEHFADFRGLRTFLGLFAGELNKQEPHCQKNRKRSTMQGRSRLILDQWCLISALEDTGSSLHNS